MSTNFGARWRTCGHCLRARAPHHCLAPVLLPDSRALHVSTRCSRTPCRAADAAPLDAGDGMSFRRPGTREGVFRQLRRGQIQVEAEVDLHHLGRHAAEDALREFLADCVIRGLGCVRVIHGKGLRSGPGGPGDQARRKSWLAQVRECGRVRQRAPGRRRQRRRIRAAGATLETASGTPLKQKLPTRDPGSYVAVARESLFAAFGRVPGIADQLVQHCGRECAPRQRKPEQ